MRTGKVWNRIGSTFVFVALFLILGASQARAQTQTSILLLSIAPNSFSESAGGQAATATLTRNTSDISAPLVVTLSSNVAGEISLPATVTIPAGLASTTFVIGVIDDQKVDFQKVVSILATAPNFLNGFATVTIEDDEAVLTLSISPTTIREDDGPTAATGTVTRTVAASTSDTVISLTSSNPDLVRVPPSVTILAGQTSVTFPIGVLDNDDLDAQRTVQISAIRSGFSSGQVSVPLLVNDDESALELTITPLGFNEGSGSNAAVATIERTSIAAAVGPITLKIVSSDTSEATIPSTVVLAKDQTRVELPVAAVDDSVVDGPQKVTITVSSPGLITTNKEFMVADNDSARLGLTLNTTQTSESNLLSGAIGTLTRNTPITQDLTVNLRSSNPNQATVPTSVRIPSGAVSVDFPVRVVDDSLRDGAQSVTISASQTGFNTVTSGPLSIFDNEGPSLRVTLVSREIQEGDGIVRGTVAHSGPTGSPVTVTLALSNAAAARFGVPDGGTQIQVVIPAGSASATFTLAARDNEIPDDIQNTTILATAAGFQNGAATLRINDDEDPAILTLSVSPALYFERAGPRAALATVSRNTATTSDVTVIIGTSDALVAAVPLTAIIPTGSTSTTFYISTIDNLDCTPFNAPDPKLATVTVNVAGFQSGSAEVGARDDDECSGVAERILSAEIYKTTPPPFPPKDNIDDIKVDEGAGTRGGTIRVFRIDDVQATHDLVVDLTSSDSARGGAAPLTVGRPTRITIPAGRAFLDVPLSVVENNTVANDCLTVKIDPIPVGFIDRRLPVAEQRLLPINQVGSGIGYTLEGDSFQIVDNESLIASISVRPGTFNESGSSGVATGTVTLLSPSVGDQRVTIKASDPSEIRVINGTNGTLDVTIPTGQLSASFAVIAVDDDLLDGDQKAFLEATTSCSSKIVRAQVTVRDNEVPALFVERVTSFNVDEGKTTQFSVRRNSPTTAALTVALSTSDATEAAVPASVTIPAGQTSATFAVRGVNDNLVDGKQTVRVTAATAGLRSGGLDIVVVDTTIAALTLSVPQSTLSEGRTLRATLTRNTLTNSAMTVLLVSANPSRLRVPGGITIPAGAASVTFDVTAVEDKLQNGNVAVAFTATKTGLASATATITALDND